MAHFNTKSIKVPNLTILSIVMALLKGLKDKHFKQSFSKRSLKTIIELRL